MEFESPAKCFRHDKTADVDPTALGQELSNFPSECQMMANYDIPDFMYHTMSFNSRIDSSAIALHKQLLQYMETLGGGRYFSQKLVEAAWDVSFRAKLIALYKDAHKGRAPKTDYLNGVRYGQARSIRIMHNHHRKHEQLASASTTFIDDATDEEIKQALVAYQAAVDVDSTTDVDATDVEPMEAN